MALHELSKAVPEEQRPLPAHLVEVADNNTSALPNTGMDAGLPSLARTHSVQSPHCHACQSMYISAYLLSGGKTASTAVLSPSTRCILSHERGSVMHFCGALF